MELLFVIVILLIFFGGKLTKAIDVTGQPAGEAGCLGVIFIAIATVLAFFWVVTLIWS